MKPGHVRISKPVNFYPGIVGRPDKPRKNPFIVNPRNSFHYAAYSHIRIILAKLLEIIKAKNVMPYDDRLLPGKPFQFCPQPFGFRDAGNQLDIEVKE